jgi:hypothetical protein
MTCRSGALYTAILNMLPPAPNVAIILIDFERGQYIAVQGHFPNALVSFFLILIGFFPMIF